MNTTHGDGNQPPSDLRVDPGADRGHDADTRDPVSPSSETLSGAARALVEQWREEDDSLIGKMLKDEAEGNEGRRQWNARDQVASEAQDMLNGAVNTIERLLELLASFRLARVESIKSIKAERKQMQAVGLFQRGLREALEVEVQRLSALLAQAQPENEFIDVVVNGQPVHVKAGSVRSVIEQAISLSGQIGAPMAQWELRTRDGEVIPHTLSDGGEWMLAGGTLLFLNLGAALLAQAGAPQANESLLSEAEMVTLKAQFGAAGAPETGKDR